MSYRSWKVKRALPGISNTGPVGGHWVFHGSYIELVLSNDLLCFFHLNGRNMVLVLGAILAQVYVFSQNRESKYESLLVWPGQVAQWLRRPHTREDGSGSAVGCHIKPLNGYSGNGR